MDIKEIEQQGNVRMKIAKMMRELIPLVESAYPGHEVYIGPSSRETTQSLNGDGERHATRARFAELMKVDQIATVLRSNGPMHKRDIFETIKSRGGDISYSTLGVALTRFFQKEGGGVWTLKK